ncbi:hypothetical protein QAD02_019855 [Eretmocerus hayati]|uniref:Uncharacterized protein n=1 Tax=Eretmocerus hayati TaxID=131215 RepID=A0ACC2PLT8_9HYME|nr:hypothetical protein QAD02_019855 [Eretmocerus hayati]
MSQQLTEELVPSDLGTLEYWEKTYALEIENFKDHGDVGEVWFGSNSTGRVVRFINTNLGLDKTSDRLIDLGCGNGVLLAELAQVGFENLVGVDYSAKAIELARRVLDEKGFSKIKLFVYDVLCDSTDPDTNELGKPFALAHDKGTYDAVSLCPDKPRDKRVRYVKNVHRILKDDGYLVLTSCNWTKAELTNHLCDYFELVDEIPTKSFSFGGQTGSRITQLIFKKKNLVT